VAVLLLFLASAAAQEPTDHELVEAVVESVLRQSQPYVINTVLDAVVAALLVVFSSLVAVWMRMRGIKVQPVVAPRPQRQPDPELVQATVVYEEPATDRYEALPSQKRTVPPVHDRQFGPEMTKELPAAPEPSPFATPPPAPPVVRELIFNAPVAEIELNPADWEEDPDTEVGSSPLGTVVPFPEYLSGAADMDRLTRHFTMGEFCITELRLWGPKNRQCGEEYRETLIHTAKLMEDVRELCGGRPVHIHSGYRHPKLNRQIGGSETSQHCKGEAADFHVAGVDLELVFESIRRSSIRFGQLLLEDLDEDGEYDHIHISLGHPWRERAQCGQVAIVRGRHYQWLERPPVS
jgi:zinc D-Ala-D-Ala carboxypeptidase